MIYSFQPFGFEGSLVTVETDLRQGIPAFDIVGLSDSSVVEVRTRVQCAVRNSGYEFPSERVLESLSPADLKKEGASYDLPVALDIIRAQKGMRDFPDVLVMGELELSGHTRPVRAVTQAMQTAVEKGILYAIIPEADVEIPSGIKVRKVRNLADAFLALYDLYRGKYDTFTEGKEEEGSDEIQFFNLDTDEESLDRLNNDVNYRGVKGLKYAMTVATAGHHHLLVTGSPGCGKTAVLSRMSQILPKLNREEKSTVDRIYSVTGREIYENERPWRNPYCNSNIEAMCGGGPDCRPGEISLAHNGVLYLNEGAEFRTSVLQMLRVPLENGKITLCRAGRTTVYPANFQLVMSTNPCPCGNYGSKTKICLCSARSIEQYWQKFSAPLLDRFAIRYNMEEDDSQFPSYTLEEMRSHVKLAWERQFARQGKFNNDLSTDEVEQYISMTNDARNELERVSERTGLSSKTQQLIMKTAQTLLDMEFSPSDKITLLEMKMAIELHSKTPLEA